MRRPQGIGELSQIGMRQHFRVGTVLREEYITKAKLISSDYNCTYLQYKELPLREEEKDSGKALDRASRV